MNTPVWICVVKQNAGSADSGYVTAAAGVVPSTGDRIAVPILEPVAGI